MSGLDTPMLVLLAQAGGQPAGGGMFQMLVLFVAIGAIMYFLVIRPQQQERKAHEELLASLSKDMEIVTSGGVHGRVVSVGESTLVIEVAPKTKMTIDKVAVARRADQPAPQQQRA